MGIWGFLLREINGLQRNLNVCGAKELTPAPGRSAAEGGTAPHPLLSPFIIISSGSGVMTGFPDFELSFLPGNGTGGNLVVGLS